MQREQLGKPGFQADDRAMIAAICRKVDGLPHGHAFSAEAALMRGSSQDVMAHTASCLKKYEIIGDKMVLSWILATRAGALVLDEEPKTRTGYGALAYSPINVPLAMIAVGLASTSRSSRGSRSNNTN